MRGVKGTIKITEGKMLVKEDYDNDHRTKAATLGEWKHQSNSIQKIDSRQDSKVTLVYFNNVEINGVEVNILSQMVQLLLNSFKAKPHPQKDMKRKLMVGNCNLRDKFITRVR